MRVDTPDNIDSYSRDEMINFLKETVGDKFYSHTMEDAYDRLQDFYKFFNQELTNSVIQIILNTNKNVLVSANAGSGKTTLVQTELLFLEYMGIYSKSVVLNLVYNKDNVKDIEDRQSKMTKALNEILDEKISKSNSTSRTYHSFARYFFKKFESLVGMINYGFIDELESKKMIYNLIKESNLNNNDKFALKADKLLAAYGYIIESDLKVTLETVLNCKHITELACSDIARQEAFGILIRYSRLKTQRKVYDFSDMLLVLKQLSKTKDFLDIISKYGIIVVDEAQDLSPIMWNILSTISKQTNVRFIVIGDEDQNLYHFRGSKIDNFLNFRELFEDSKVFTLGHNRRCAFEITEFSKEVIKQNKARFDKNITSSNRSGTCMLLPVNSLEEQLKKTVASVVKGKKNKLDLREFCLCYREKSLSYPLGYLLAKEKIQVNTLSGFNPFEFCVFKDIIDILNIFIYPKSAEHIGNLYKIFPISKKEISNLLKRDGVERNPEVPFFQLDYSKIKAHETKTLMDSFRVIYEKLKLDNLNTYIKEIMNLYNKYHFLKVHNKDMYRDDFNLMAQYAFDYFNQENNANDVIGKYKLDKYRYESEGGVTLSTFHKLKGLEWDNVIILGLNDSIFPKYNYIFNSNMSGDEKIEELESECRLLYVACTRARNKLVMFSSNLEPPIFISNILKKHKLPTAVKTDFSEVFVNKNTSTSDKLNKIELNKGNKELELEFEDKEPEISLDTSLENLSCIIDSIPVKPKKPKDILDIESSFDLLDDLFSI